LKNISGCKYSKIKNHTNNLLKKKPLLSQKSSGFFVVESIIIVLLNIVLSFGLCMLAYNIMNVVLTDFIGKSIAAYNIISMTFGRFAVLSAISMASMAVALALPLYFINRKEPIDIIRKANE
jgi:ABC-type antimicrobial peptide transport system permease subunit